MSIHWICHFKFSDIKPTVLPKQQYGSSKCTNHITNESNVSLVHICEYLWRLEMCPFKCSRCLFQLTILMPTHDCITGSFKSSWARAWWSATIHFLNNSHQTYACKWQKIFAHSFLAQPYLDTSAEAPSNFDLNRTFGGFKQTSANIINSSRHLLMALMPLILMPLIFMPLILALMPLIIDWDHNWAESYSSTVCTSCTAGSYCMEMGFSGYG